MGSDDPLNGAVKLSFSDDGLECVASIAAGADLSDLSEGAVTALLGRKGVINERIDPDGVRDFVRGALREEGPNETVVARGRAPEDGIAGHFAFAAEIQEQFDGIERREHALRHAPPLATTGRSRGVDGDDGIDFYNVSSFVIVRAGATIGTVLEPTPGVHGEGVRGDLLAASSGQGPGVTFGDGLEVHRGNEVRATIDGRLVRGIEELRVEETLRVRGSVDFSTGNVDFPGDVVVAGGVCDRFVVRCDGDLEVRELVEAAQIDTDFDVVFATGMAGREIGRVRVGGTLTSRYLDGVSGRIDGACSVAREINACALVLGSTLSCRDGAVMGGELRVSGEVDVGRLGGQGGVETHLWLGWHEELEEAIASLNTAVDERVPKGPKRRKSDRATVVALQSAGRRIEAGLSKLTSSTLKVVRAVYPGVRLVGRGWEAEFGSPVEGPLVIEPDDQGEPTLRGLARGERIPLGRVARVRPSDEMAVLSGSMDRLNHAA